MSRKHKNICTTIKYIKHFLILASANTGCIFISAFSSLFGIPIWIRSSAIGLKICAKNWRSIIKKKKKKHDKIVLLAKSKLHGIEVLISKALIDSNISHDKFFSINNVLKEYDNMKKEKEIKKLKQFIEDFSLFIRQCYRTVWSVEKKYRK